MLYTILKTITETTIVQYVCQECGGKADEGSISIGSIKQNMVDIRIICPQCQSEAHMHAEIANMDHEMMRSPEGQAIIHQAIRKSENAIKDTDIKNIEKSLSEIRSIEDLLK